MTLLTACQKAQRLLSLSVTSAIVSDGQETQNLLWALADMEAVDILRRSEYRFPALTRTQSFTASLASLQSSGKPSNFKRFIRDTAWNATTDRKLGGPLSDQDWGLANGQPVTSTISQWLMFRYDGLHIFPVPTAANTITYDYVINTPILDNDGTTYKSAFVADNDTYLLGDNILTLALVWRYKQSKGRDYAEDLKNYELALAGESVAATGSAAISIAPMDYDPVTMAPNLPDGNYPG